MLWAYDDTLPTDKDKVRFYIADTDESRQLVSDPAIDAMISLYEDVFEASAALADGLAARFARVASITVDGLVIKGADRAEQYRILASNLRRQSALSAGGALGVPFVGGVSITEMEGVAANTDRAPNKFNIGQDDFPGTSLPSLPFGINGLR